MDAIQADLTNIPEMSGLARALVQSGRFAAPAILALHKQSTNEKSTFIDLLLQSGKIDSGTLANFCSETFGYPAMDLSEFNLASMPEKLIDAKLMQRLQAIPLAQRGNKISVAISDPSQTQSLAQIQFQTASTIEPVIVQHDILMQILAGFSKTTQQNLNEMLDDSLDIDFLTEVNATPTESDTSEVDDAPVVRFLQKIMLDAINVGASDIHFEPFEKFYRIRLRIDGVLKEHAQPPTVDQGTAGFSHQGIVAPRHL